MTVMHPQNATNIRFPSQHQFQHQNQLDNPSAFFNLDPSAAAKQIAALNVANMTRIATNGRSPHQISPPAQNQPPFTSAAVPPSSSSILTQTHPVPGLSHDSHPNMTLPNQSSLLQDQNSPARSAPSQQSIAASLRQRRRNFLMGLAGVMAARNAPLPPALTGVPYPPNYDPAQSHWNSIEIAPHEPGFFRLAGKDVDVFKLWGLVFQNGGGAKMNNKPEEWVKLLPFFDLPEQFPVPQQNGQTSVSASLAQHYMAILHPFEDAYVRNVQEQHRRATSSRPSGSQPPNTAQLPGRHPMNGMAQPIFPQTPSDPVLQLAQQSNLLLNGVSNSSTAPPSVPHTPHLRPPSAAIAQSSPGNGPVGTDSDPTPSLTARVSGTDILDPELQGIKRKLDSEDGDNKRVRQKTAESEQPEASSSQTGRSSLPPSSATATPNGTSTKASQPARPRAQPTRRKIEYVPLCREVETYGGRDLQVLNEEVTRVRDRRPLRDINDWGLIDIEALTMSLRSRLVSELSYALTTFTLLSTMKGQTPGSGFPIYQCPDLLDEVLDLLEDEAFGDGATSEAQVAEFCVATHRELVNVIHEEGSQPFASLEWRQGSNNPEHGPRQRNGNYVLAVTNIIRNLSTITDNVPYIAQHERLLDLMLRVCGANYEGSRPRATSPALSLLDLVNVRKDALQILHNVVNQINLASKVMRRVTGNIFALVSSYLIDPAERQSPVAYVQQNAHLASGGRRPPSLADTALDVFTRLSQADSNRQIVSQVVPSTAIWRLFEALVHRLPVQDHDFQVLMREPWLYYMERVVLSIYSLAFLSPPELKQKIKADRGLRFGKVMLRMVQKFLLNPNQEVRIFFAVCARRAIEAMKVVDDGEDSFDTSQTTTMPTMSFGMGYGETGEGEKEKGTGMLGGYRNLTWDLLMMRELDDVAWPELESLTRVG